MIDIQVGDKPVFPSHESKEELEKYYELKYHNDMVALRKKMDYFYDKNMQYAKGNRILLWIAIILLLIDLISRLIPFMIKIAIIF